MADHFFGSYLILCVGGRLGGSYWATSDLRTSAIFHSNSETT